MTSPADIKMAAAMVAPTPQNTPLVTAPIAHGLSRPTVASILEDAEDVDDPYIVRRRIEGLKGVHATYTKIEFQYKKELLELDRKYLALYTPNFERRRKIVNGEVEPTDEEIEAGYQEDLKEDPDAKRLSGVAAEEEKALVGIPLFWLMALRNHPTIDSLITERDEEALHHITDITYEFLPPEKPGYKISFYFSPNKFFTNEVLTKTYNYEEEPDYAGEFVYAKSEGTKIDWKEDMDLTKEIEVRKQRNKNTNRTRMVRRVKDIESFFNFFSPPSPPTREELEDETLDEEKLEELQDRLELDYEVGEDLKDKIIPRALDYFTGKANDYDLSDSEFGDHPFGDGADDDEIMYDDDSDGENNYPSTGRRPPSSNRDATAAGECRQQ